MAKMSAGILLYRFTNKILELLIVHPGGPFWSKKDLGAWSIPKGEFTENEDALKAAIREFQEEMGEHIEGDFISMTPIKQHSGKTVYAFALEHDFDVAKIKSNTFTIEWPPKSGKQQEFPEIDKGEWFDYKTCKQKMNESQFEIVEELISKLNIPSNQLIVSEKTDENPKKSNSSQLDLFG